MPKIAKARRVILTPAASNIIRPTAELLADCGLPPFSVIKPDAADIDHYGTVAEMPASDTLGNLVADINGAFAALPADIEPEPANSENDDAPFTGLLASDPPAPVPLAASEPAPVSAGASIAEPASLNDKALARAAAARAVAAFYSGRSLPFKSAADLKRKSPINFALNRAPTERSAALIAAILTYCNVQPGTLEFVRGSGAVPGRLLGFTGPDAERIFNAGPESGGLSNCLPDRIAYINGPLAGAGAENAVFRLNYAACRANLLSHNVKQASGEHLFSAALGLLDILNAPPAVTPAADSEPTAA